MVSADFETLNHLLEPVNLPNHPAIITDKGIARHHIQNTLNNHITCTNHKKNLHITSKLKSSMANLYIHPNRIEIYLRTHLKCWSCLQVSNHQNPRKHYTWLRKKTSWKACSTTSKAHLITYIMILEQLWAKRMEDWIGSREGGEEEKSLKT